MNKKKWYDWIITILKEIFEIAKKSAPVKKIPEEENDTYKRVFDKDLIMSDAEFTDFRALTIDEIQEFLVKKESCLKDIKVAKEGKLVPLSQFLGEQCAEFGLNPKVVLSMFQKEMGLISRKKKPTKKQLDRALGVGMTDEGDMAEFYGIGKQIRGCCRILLKWFEYSKNKKKIGVERKISDGVIRPKNHSTFAFYMYTPWIGTEERTVNGIKYEVPFGNFLMWKVYRWHW